MLQCRVLLFSAAAYASGSLLLYTIPLSIPHGSLAPGLKNDSTFLGHSGKLSFSLVISESFTLLLCFLGGIQMYLWKHPLNVSIPLS